MMLLGPDGDGRAGLYTAPEADAVIQCGELQQFVVLPPRKDGSSRTRIEVKYVGRAEESIGKATVSGFSLSSSWVRHRSGNLENPTYIKRRGVNMRVVHYINQFFERREGYGSSSWKWRKRAFLVPVALRICWVRTSGLQPQSSAAIIICVENAQALKDDIVKILKEERDGFADRGPGL